MSIFSAWFAVFLLVTAILYFIFPKKIQWVVLLSGNLVFYAYAGPKYLIFILGCTFITWFAALQIERNSLALRAELAEVSDKEEKAACRKAHGSKQRKLISAALILTLGVWIVIKYGRFVLDTVSPLFSHEGPLFGSFSPIVPLGMSFYTFDAIGYLIDISRGKYAAEKNFFRYLTFISFFPHIIQGPFSRFDVLGKTLFEEHRFSYDRLCQGASRILWGYFKKLIIADKLARSVNEIFSNYDNYWGIHILFVIILYGIQIYADFSGYMDIVSGISHILGISLDKNFEQPYFAVSVEDFWRRWHMTLGHWFRDYLFYPIAMSKRTQKIGKTFRTKFSPRAGKLVTSAIAMFWVWSATGLWHGSSWTYLAWGWLNMIVMLFSQIFEPVYEKMRNTCHISLKNPVWHFIRILRTFFLICFFRFFSRADTVHTAVQMIAKIFQGLNRKLLLQPMKLFPKMSSKDIFIVLIGILMMLIVDILCEKGKWETVKQKTPFPIRDLIYVILIYSIILFAGSGGDIAANFMYANF